MVDAPQGTKATKPKRSSADIFAQNDFAIELPITTTARKPTGTRIGECYLLDRPRHYIIGQTSKASASYLANINSVAEAIKAEKVVSKVDARELLASLVLSCGPEVVE